MKHKTNLKARKTIGDNLRYRRKEILKWSQEKLSQEAGVYCATIGKIERGEVDGRFGTVCALVDAMGINIEDIRSDIN